MMMMMVALVSVINSELVTVFELTQIIFSDTETQFPGTVRLCKASFLKQAPAPCSLYNLWALKEKQNRYYCFILGFFMQAWSVRVRNSNTAEKKT